jgi:hypothetical protein
MSEGTVTVRMGEVVEPHGVVSPPEGIWTRTLVHYDAEETPSVIFVDVESHNLDTGQSNPVVSIRFSLEEISFIASMVAAGMETWGGDRNG